MAETTEARRQQVMVGELPQDFLRFSNVSQPVSHPQQATSALFSQNLVRITITVVQAKLAKNYGLTKMDPYCRIRIGHTVLETPTAHNGAKNPRWNKVLQCYVPSGMNSLYVEIFDERAFTMDDRIAWTHVSIPDSVYTGETIDDWFVLSGQQGDSMEGMINLVISYNAVPLHQAPQPIVYSAGGAAPLMVMPTMPVYYPAQVSGGDVPYAPQPPPSVVRPPGPAFNDEDVTLIKDMFPMTDEVVIRSLLEANHGNKDHTINNLLSMNS